jgi:hypothetical protein
MSVTTLLATLAMLAIERVSIKQYITPTLKNLLVPWYSGWWNYRCHIWPSIKATPLFVCCIIRSLTLAAGALRAEASCGAVVVVTTTIEEARAREFWNQVGRETFSGCGDPTSLFPFLDFFL